MNGGKSLQASLPSDLLLVFQRCFPLSKKSVPIGVVFFVPNGSGLVTKTVILRLTTVPCTDNTVHLPSTNVE